MIVRDKRAEGGEGRRRLSMQVSTIMMMYWFFLEQRPLLAPWLSGVAWVIYVAVPRVQHILFVYNLIWIFLFFRRAALCGNKRLKIFMHNASDGRSRQHNNSCPHNDIKFGHGPRSRGGGGEVALLPLTDSVLTDSLSLSLVWASFPARVGRIVSCALKT